MTSGKELLKEDEDVRRWSVNLAEGSHWTRKAFLHHLAKYCSYRGLTPQDVVKEFETDKKKAQDNLEDYVRALKAEGKSPATLKMGLSAIKSWLGHFELQVTRKIKVTGLGSPPTLKDEKVPTRVELEKALDCGGVRTRAMMSFIAEAGLRYGSMAGLNLRDLPEFDLPTGKALKTPMRINVRAEISKSRRSFLTFLAEPKYLEAYLAERKTWDRLTPDSPVFAAARTFASHGGYVHKGDRMTSGGLSMEVRRSMRLAGLKQRPYVWRAYFDTSLLGARADKDIQSFVMGHSGTIEAAYTTRKNLSDEMIESMRQEVAEAFKPAVEGKMQVLKESLEKDFAAEFAEMANGFIVAERERALFFAGYTDDEVRAIDGRDPLLHMDPSKLTRLVNDRLEKRFAKKNGNHQKVVSASEVEKLIGEGWSYVATIPGDKAVVKEPSE